MNTQSTESHDLEITRILKAPRRLLWRAWSDPNLLAEWWCPKPWKTEVKAFEFYPGGAFHAYMSGEHLAQGVSATSTEL
jgi:uncharacterized protein YndB with AHSA1/START domain